MAKRIRKDTKGRVLHKGETYRRDKQLYCFCYTDLLGKRHSLYAPDLGKLRERERQLEQNKLDSIELYAFGKVDVNFVFDRYISTKKDLRSSTFSSYCYIYERYVRKGFGKKKIVDVRYSDVLLYYNTLIEAGLKPNTVDGIHTILHPAFQMAVRDNIIRNNPTDGAMAEIKRKMKGSTEARHALKLEEEKEFLSCLDKPENVRWRPLFTVMFGTGVRISELIGLRWEDLDFEENTISINHNVTYRPRASSGFRSSYEVSLPKTNAGIRTIPMLDKVRNALLEEKRYQDETGFKCNMEIDGMSGFIFFNRFGKIHNLEGINKTIKRIVDDHNASEEIKAVREGRKPLMIPRFSCHITRHTFCSRLCENETNVKFIQDIMGHKDIRTTLDIYAEISETKKQDVFRNLNDDAIL